MRRTRRAPPDIGPPDPYLVGLRLLGRRELSIDALRDRLREVCGDHDAVESALERLVAQGAADDRRVAATYARTAGIVKGRGRDRIRRELEAMGIARDLAREALDQALPREDEDARIDAAIKRRHPGSLDDERERHRLFAWLVRQGYEAERVRLALDRRRRGRN